MNITPEFNWITLEKIHKRDVAKSGTYTSATILDVGRDLRGMGRLAPGTELLFRDIVLHQCEGTFMIRHPDIIGTAEGA